VFGPIYTLTRIYKTTYTSVIDRVGNGSANQLLVSHTARTDSCLILPDILRLSADEWSACAWTTLVEGTHFWHVQRKRALRILAHGYALTVIRITQCDSMQGLQINTAWNGDLGRAVKTALPITKAEFRALYRRASGATEAART